MSRPCDSGICNFNECSDDNCLPEPSVGFVNEPKCHEDRNTPDAKTCQQAKE